MKLYIAVLDEVPDYIVPTLVAHTILNADKAFSDLPLYRKWKTESYKKCVCRVNRKEFDKIAALPGTFLGYENHTLGGTMSCAIAVPVENEDLPKVLMFAKLWAPKNNAG